MCVWGCSGFGDISLALGLVIQKKSVIPELAGVAGGRRDGAEAAFSVAPRGACPSEVLGVKLNGVPAQHRPPPCLNPPSVGALTCVSW